MLGLSLQRLEVESLEGSRVSWFHGGLVLNLVGDKISRLCSMCMSAWTRRMRGFGSRNGRFDSVDVQRGLRSAGDPWHFGLLGC